MRIPGSPGIAVSTTLATFGSSTSSPVKISLPVLEPYGKEINWNSSNLTDWQAFLMFSMVAFTVATSSNNNSLLKTVSAGSVVKRCFNREIKGMARFISFLSTLSLILLLSSRDCCSNNSRTNAI